MLIHITRRFALTTFACIGMFSTEAAWSAEKTIFEELAAIVQVADAQVAEGTAELVDLRKVEIAVNFAKYKMEEIAKDELRKKNAPTEKKLLSITRSAYQQKRMSTAGVLASIDFISNHR